MLTSRDETVRIRRSREDGMGMGRHARDSSRTCELACIFCYMDVNSVSVPAHVTRTPLTCMPRTWS